jgi:hypothetical protein
MRDGTFHAEIIVLFASRTTVYSVGGDLPKKT